MQTEQTTANANGVGISEVLAVLAKNLRTESDTLRKYAERTHQNADYAAANTVEAITCAVERTVKSTANGELCERAK